MGSGLALAATCASLFVTGFIATVFMKPHAFGSRDGQGAAGLAALILLAGAAASLVSGVGLLVVTAKLRKRFGIGWAWPVALGAPVVVVALAITLALLDG